MVAKIIDGKLLSSKIKKQLAKKISAKIEQGLNQPNLAVIIIGDDPASHIYVRNKRLACEEVGIKSTYYPLPTTTTENELKDLIFKLNNTKSINGILLQLPLPKHINSDTLLELIDPKKDVDGFHPYNLGRLTQRKPELRPCTPYGIIMLLNSINETYKNKHAVIIGASNIVGRPLAMELLLAGSTITICHRFTKNLKSFVEQADILVSAVGIPSLVKGEWIKKNSTVIDVGINRLANGTIMGDIEFDKASERALWITPVPGGVGPMTTTMLLENTLTAAINQNLNFLNN
ncbi:bifunctional methylenetetrahydrofolate dehydrogenase/methenyltetrahydrofolate cyclohydrolase FolD [Gammaproteobacteria bacterium]|nr:bifunctional methylenetetrahydrofolate dehydrogenase/methenyltetrahydrofolate cyclohydrolase FolD [Gammaproteobacteria bacterium]